MPEENEKKIDEQIKNWAEGGSDSGEATATAKSADDSDKKDKTDNQQRAARGTKPPKINLKEAVAIVKDFYERAGGEAEIRLIQRNSKKIWSF